MSLEAVLAAIRLQGDSEAQAIDQRAQAEVERILAEAERQREAEQHAVDLRARAAARSERARILQAASLEGLQVTGAAQQAVVDRVLAELRLRLSRLRSTPEYPVVLQRLLVEAVETLAGSLESGDSMQLLTDPRDRDVLEPVLEALALAVRPRYALETWGGVLVTNVDGRVSVDNTLETRLEEAAAYFRRYIPSLIEHGSEPASADDGLT